jgi:16S rRNA (guanine966-N2)-methyltransferase
VRVIAGEAKGRKLKAVPGGGTRPILDRVKVALFDILSNQIGGSRFLDLYAGTGGVGIEALSRGATHVTLVENSPLALRVIRDNLALTGFSSRASIVSRDVLRFLESGGTASHDIVFLAPPQYLSLVPPTLSAIESTNNLASNLLVIVQQDPKEPKSGELRRLRQTDERRYGTTLLLFYEIDP